MGKKAALQMGIEIEVELEKYKKYRTLLPMTDSELQNYQTPEQIGNTLDKNYMKILFGEDCFEEDDEDDCFGEDDEEDCFEEEDLWRDKLTKIVFSDSIPEESVIRSSETAIYGDISEAKDGSVIGWVEKLDAVDFEYDMEYILHIDGNGKVCAPVDSKELFYGFSEVREIEFGNAFDTSQTVNMEYMFGWCEKLSILDVSSFHTENVTGMNGMFCKCRRLESLDLSSFTIPYDITLKSALEWWICRGCSRLKEVIVQLDGKRQSLNLDLKPEENVLNKDYKTVLFGENDEEKWAGKITKIIFSDSIPEDHVIAFSGTAIYGDISEEKDESIIGWVERNGVEYILHIDGNGKIYAPEDCKGLFADFSQTETIEFGDVFDTSQAVNMENMFRYCRNLSILDVSGFDTQNVTNMAGMFGGCNNLRYLHGESAWDTSQVTDMNFMFSGCYSLREVDFSSFHTRNVTYMNNMFSNCSGLKELNVSSFDTSSVRDMSSMFYGCSGLKELNVSSFDTSSVRDMSSMFYGCSGLKELNVSGFDTSRAVWMEDMFKNCKKLETLDISSFTFPHDERNRCSMFSGCENLNSISAGTKLFEAEMYEQAVPLLKKCVEFGKEKAGSGEVESEETGNGQAEYLLGICYQKGLGVDENLEEAFEYLEAAANKGHVDAMIRSGDCYYEGIGTEQDYGKALEWYQKAEEHGAEVDMDKLENARKMSRKGVFQKLKGLFKR